MYVFLTIFIILSVLVISTIVMLAVFPVKISVSYDSEQIQDYRIIFLWLKPFIKGSLTKDNGRSIIKIYLFSKKIIEKNLENLSLSKLDSLSMMKDIHPHLIKLQTSYGFEDPSITGMVCASINMLSEYIRVDDLDNHPDFSMNTNYFNASATAEINALNSLRVMLRNRSKLSRMQPQY